MSRLARAVMTLLLPLSLVSVIALPHASAHELLPRELVDYMQEHPNATEAEINAFLEQSPELYDFSKSGRAKILDAALNPGGSFFHNAISFIRIGMEHIFSGADHILFVLSLLLVFVSIRSVVKLATIFTIAHSVTLILAGTGVLTLTSRIVEPMIALSIAYVAITSVFFRRFDFFGSPRSKAITVFLFGLFHGLGFAGLLQDLSIPDGRFLESLIFFNVGIEIGQVVIMTFAIPFILLTKNKSWHLRLIRVIAVLISMIAMVWFVERAFQWNIIS